MAISTIGSNSLNPTSDLVIDSVTVGKGGGSIASNTAVGNNALAATNTGTVNSAFGQYALYVNTSGTGNTASGNAAMFSNTTGYYNNAFGYAALYTNVSGIQNNAFGYLTLAYNTGNYNSAFGHQALYSNSTASQNTAMGFQALYANTTGASNTAVGHNAGVATTTGQQNTYLGQGAGAANTNSDGNTLIGQNAGKLVNTNGANICIGREAGNFLTTGYYNVIIGSYGGGGSPGMTASTANFVVIADGSGAPRIWFDNNGIPSMSNLYSHTTSASANVYVDGNLTLYRSTSSIKYKTNVQDAVHGLNEVLKLRPVTYSGIADNDSHLTLGGLIAEEVDAAGLTEFVQYAEDGSPDALAYGQMVSLCIKAIQELNAKVTDLETKLAAK